jgi:hypothetical protein
LYVPSVLPPSAAPRDKPPERGRRDIGDFSRRRQGPKTKRNQVKNAPGLSAPWREKTSRPQLGAYFPRMEP